MIFKYRPPAAEALRVPVKTLNAREEGKKGNSMYVLLAQLLVRSTRGGGKVRIPRYKKVQKDRSPIPKKMSRTLNLYGRKESEPPYTSTT